MTKQLKMTIEQAKRIALSSALLDGKYSPNQGKEELYQIINHLGYIQIDTISVVERAHHHVLWTRFPDYRPAMIDELQTTDKKIFEYWGHGMSYLPMEYFRYFKHVHKRFKNPTSKWTKLKLDENKHLFPRIMKRIRTEGALSPKDFESGDQKKRNGWWDWKPAKLALELLYWQGKLMISKRVNFQKYYDLTERVLPNDIDTKLPTQKELSRFWIRQGLKTLGIATLGELSKFYYHIDKVNLHKELKSMLKNKEILDVKIGSLTDTSYITVGALDMIKSEKQENTRAFILSPFDNFLINRSRIKKLFDFDYAIECYLPEVKRKIGYFSLPILWKGAFAGLIDIKADRSEKNLIINNLVMEKKPGDDSAFYPMLSEELHRFKSFNGCDTITFKKRNNLYSKKLTPFF